LGKFLQVDPMADKYGSLTTYNYAGNNPVIFNDPMGDDFWDDIMNDPDGHWENPDKEEQDYQPGVSVFSGIWAFMDRADAMSDALMGVDNPVWNSGTYGSAAGSGGRWASSFSGGQWVRVTTDIYNKMSITGTDIVLGYEFSHTQISYRYEEQGGATDYDKLMEFTRFFFGNEMNSITENGFNLVVVLDNDSKFTSEGEGRRRAVTVPIMKTKTAKIYLNPSLLKDAKNLYIHLGHEMVHAVDIANGNLTKWLKQFPTDALNILETHGYMWSAAAEDGFGVDYTSSQKNLDYYKSLLPAGFTFDRK
jgi:hypothetical protein